MSWCKIGSVRYGREVAALGPGTARRRVVMIGGVNGHDRAGVGPRGGDKRRVPAGGEVGIIGLIAGR